MLGWIIVISVLFVSCFIQLWKERNRYHELFKSMDKVCKDLKKTTSELASVRVKHGQTFEVFMPLMKHFEKQLGPKENAMFLGQPIDLIYFNPDEIIFVEVKTGNSKLSSRQRHIKHLIKEKKVRWEEVNDASQPASQDIDQQRWVDMMKIVPHRKNAESPQEESN